MISTRRQVINEQDRYGGFDASGKSRVYSENSEANGEIYSGFSGEHTANESAQGYTYTVVETPRQSKTVVQTPMPTITTRPAKRSREDIMPKINTKVVHREEKAEATEATTKIERQERAAASSTRTKVILAVYVVAVVLLAAIVIITGIAVTNSGDALSSLESDYALKNELVLSQRQQLALLSDETYIRGEASEMNMKNITDAVTIVASEGVAPVEYKSRTNIFDTICDWLSGILK